MYSTTSWSPSVRYSSVGGSSFCVCRQVTEYFSMFASYTARGLSHITSRPVQLCGYACTFSGSELQTAKDQHTHFQQPYLEIVYKSNIMQNCFGVATMFSMGVYQKYHRSQANKSLINHFSLCISFQHNVTLTDACQQKVFFFFWCNHFAHSHTVGPSTW